MKIALILSICSAFSGAGTEYCTPHIVKLYDSVIPCTIDMDANRQTLDDRYLSCGSVDESLLTDRTAGRTVPEIIADLNREFN